MEKPGKQTKRSIQSIVPLCGMMLFFSCMADHRVFMADVDPTGWEPDEAIEVMYENHDTVSLVDLALVIRHLYDRPDNAVTLRIETHTPDSLVTADTVQLGKLSVLDQIRKRDSDFAEAETPYRTFVRLSTPGTYRFRLSPVNLQEPITGIVSAGIKVVPAGNQ